MPVIDLADPDAAATAARLRSACMEHGFFYLIGHGIDPALMDAALKECRALFALPVEEKLAMRPPPEAQESGRGYSPYQSEMLNPQEQRQPCTQESFRLKLTTGHGAEADAAARASHPWPDPAVAPGFRTTLEAYHEALEAVAYRVTQRLLEAVGLDPVSTMPLCVCRLFGWGYVITVIHIRLVPDPHRSMDLSIEHIHRTTSTTPFIPAAPPPASCTTRPSSPIQPPVCWPVAATRTGAASPSCSRYVRLHSRPTTRHSINTTTANNNTNNHSIHHHTGRRGRQFGGATPLRSRMGPRPLAPAGAPFPADLQRRGHAAALDERHITVDAAPGGESPGQGPVLHPLFLRPTGRCGGGVPAAV